MSQNQQPLPSGSTVTEASKRARQEDNLTVPTTNTPFISPATSFTDVNVNSEAIALNNNTLIYYKTLRKIERGILKANHHKNFLTSHLDKGTTPLHYALSRKSEFDKSAIQIKNFLTGHVKSGHLPPYAHLFLTYKFPRIPLLYLLPKIHKRDNPGRPIISAVSSPTEKISAFVDSILRPLVVTLPSFVKDTTDFLLKIQHVKVQPHHCLLTIDVSSLYTNIPHIEGLKACRDTLLSRMRDNPHTWFVLTLLRFVLTLNYFEFYDKFYHQISGTAMGTKLAPNYANIFHGTTGIQID